MLDKAEIIRQLQVEAKFHYSEGERLEKAAQILSEGVITTLLLGMPNPKYPDYQASWDTLEKIKYIENIEHKFWTLAYMETMLREIEGEEKGGLTFQAVRAYVYKNVDLKAVVRMKYDNARDGFYSTHQEWVEHTPDEPIKYRVNEHYAPDQKYLAKLTEEQRNPERIKFDGIA